MLAVKGFGAHAITGSGKVSIYIYVASLPSTSKKFLQIETPSPPSSCYASSLPSVYYPIFLFQSVDLNVGANNPPYSKYAK